MWKKVTVYTTHRHCQGHSWGHCFQKWLLRCLQVRQHQHCSLLFCQGCFPRHFLGRHLSPHLAPRSNCQCLQQVCQPLVLRIKITSYDYEHVTLHGMLSVQWWGWFKWPASAFLRNASLIAASSEADAGFLTVSSLAFLVMFLALDLDLLMFFVVTWSSTSSGSSAIPPERSMATTLDIFSLAPPLVAILPMGLASDIWAEEPGCSAWVANG